MSQTSTTNTTLNVIEELSGYDMGFDYLSDANQTLVLDIYKVGELLLNDWAIRLKQTGELGRIYAYDHRLDGDVAEGLPEVSIMFEELHGDDGLRRILEMVTEGNSHTRRLLHNFQARLLDEADRQANLSVSSDLLSFASAF